MKLWKKIIKTFAILSIIGITILVGLYIYAYFLPPISLNTANSYYLYDNKDNMIYQGSNNSE